jgi:hypothetical protein
MNRLLFDNASQGKARIWVCGLSASDLVGKHHQLDLTVRTRDGPVPTGQKSIDPIKYKEWCGQ